MTFRALKIPNPKGKASNGISVLATDSEDEAGSVQELVKCAYLK